MRVRLLPCPTCARHIQRAEAACPFCGAEVAFAEPPPLPNMLEVSRLSRTARVALGAALAAATLPGCAAAPAQNSPPPPPSATGQPGYPHGPDDDGSPVAEYGAPAPPDDGAHGGPGSGPGAVAPLYGMPAPVNDAGAAPQPPPPQTSPMPFPDDGTMRPEYGAPPIHDPGTMRPMYGAPTPRR